MSLHHRRPFPDSPAALVDTYARQLDPAALLRRYAVLREQDRITVLLGVRELVRHAALDHDGTDDVTAAAPVLDRLLDAVPPDEWWLVRDVLKLAHTVGSPGVVGDTIRRCLTAAVLRRRASLLRGK